MSPGGATNDPSGKTKAPASVFLMELPGLAIAREDLDVNYWANSGFEGRIPDGVFAAFVDRAPKYWDTTFTDSGARISDLWYLFMTSYVVDPNDDPVALKAVATAEAKLANSSLETDFLTALDAFDNAQNAAFQRRKDCLSSRADPTFCAIEQVVPELRSSVAWFNMEVRRRSLLNAQATILALQTSDLKSVFANALQDFQRALRIDVGAAGYGTKYYATFATPSNWWTWWPVTSYNYDLIADVPAGSNSGVGDMLFSECQSQGSPCFPQIDPTKVVILSQPQNGQVSLNTTSGFIHYVANPGFSGADYFSILPTNDTASALSISVGVGSGLSAAARSAFATVTCASSESTTSSSSSYTSVNVGVAARVRYGLVRVSGGTNVGVQVGSSSFSSSDTSSKMTFSIAKVQITRPWLNPLLLAFYPVGMKGIVPGAWSDGTGLPSSTVDYQLPLLPTSFVVAKDIVIANSALTASNSASSYAVKTDTSIAVSYGPFFSGKARVQTSNTGQRKQEKSTADSSGLNIPGPQVIGWVCNPLPKFPNADWRDPVFKYKSTA